MARPQTTSKENSLYDAYMARDPLGSPLSIDEYYDSDDSNSWETQARRQMNEANTIVPVGTTTIPTVFVFHLNWYFLSEVFAYLSCDMRRCMTIIPRVGALRSAPSCMTLPVWYRSHRGNFFAANVIRGSQKWVGNGDDELADYVVDIEFAHAGVETEAPHLRRRMRVRREYLTQGRRIPDLWCPTEGFKILPWPRCKFLVPLMRGLGGDVSLVF